MDDESIDLMEPTPATTVVDDRDSFDGTNPEVPSIPRPNCTFVIRSVSDGRALMLLDGKVVLAHPDGRGSVIWRCVETNGWIGFRNVVSGKFLGHNEQGELRCVVDKHDVWESFCVRPRDDVGYTLLMTNKKALWPLCVTTKQGREKMEKVELPTVAGTAWEFIEIR